jgi:hypothetical protein
LPWAIASQGPMARVQIDSCMYPLDHGGWATIVAETLSDRKKTIFLAQCDVESKFKIFQKVI